VQPWARTRAPGRWAAEHISSAALWRPKPLLQDHHPRGRLPSRAAKPRPCLLAHRAVAGCGHCSRRGGPSELVLLVLLLVLLLVGVLVSVQLLLGRLLVLLVGLVLVVVLVLLLVGLAGGGLLLGLLLLVLLLAGTPGGEERGSACCCTAQECRRLVARTLLSCPATPAPLAA
jgi:hypothetical protein